MPKSKSTDKPRRKPTRPTAPAERKGMTFEELPLEARLRYEHAEKWVAWAPDYQSIIASGETLEEVLAAISAAGRPRALLEWVLPVTGAIWK